MLDIDIPLLSLIIFLPLIGAGFIALFTRRNNQNTDKAVIYCGLWTSLLTLVLAIYIAFIFNNHQQGFQLVEYYAWFNNGAVAYKLGVDGFSIPLILLTSILMPICIMISSKSITTRVREYVIAFLIMESLIMGVFTSIDLLLFYIFFEASLVPLFFIIGIWGGKDRIYACFKFFLYTFAASIFMFVAIIYIYFALGTTDINHLSTSISRLDPTIQHMIWWAFFISFAVKIPMWPVHTWLPDAHVQAPTSGSVILAGVLLKIGGYGFLRVTLPFLPEISILYQPIVFTLSIIAIIYSSLVAVAQTDIKKLIAYSSIAHMGFVTIGIFSLDKQAIEGAMIQMVSHGVISAALFFSVGVLYDRTHTRDIAYFGGLAKIMPKFALLFMIFVLGSVALPGTSGFVGEFLVLLGAFKVSPMVAAGAATGMVLGAWYMLHLYRRLMLGEVNSNIGKLNDLSKAETSGLAILAIIILWIGIFPNHLQKTLELPTRHILQHMNIVSTGTSNNNNRN